MLRQRISDFRGKAIAGVRNLVGKHTDEAGLVVLTTPFLNYTSVPSPFLNETYGTAMNQAVTFGGVATVIHAGVNSGNAESGTTDGLGANKLIQSGQNFNTTVGIGHSVHNTTDDTYAIVTAVDSDTQLSLDTDIMASGESFTINDIWVGSAVQGAWNFADSGKITITSANNNDEASFDTASGRTWDTSNFTALTGKVDLDTYSIVNNNILISFGLNGVLVGNTVNLEDYIDTNSLAEQNFVIPKADLGLSGAVINDMTILIQKAGGAKPTIKFDDIQWEQTGTPLVYTVTAPEGERFHIQRIRFVIAANVALAGIAWDSFMGETMTNGLGVIRKVDGVTAFSGSLRTLSDCYNVGFVKEHEPDTDGTDTVLVMSVHFREPQIMYGNPEDNFISFIVNDDLSGLLRFTAGVTGSIEV